jgi:Mg2+/Co2+ transporter CorB
MLSAFFSSSETAMMSLERYRLKQHVALNKGWAIIAEQLLKKPDRLIGVILLGNNFVNILASAISTLIALRLGGNYGLAVATGLLTLIVLIFCEVAPKTFAAKNPELVVSFVARILAVLKKLLFPITIIVNSIANFTLWIFGEKPNQTSQNLSSEQLRIMLQDGEHSNEESVQKMILNLLELEKLSIQSIMRPINEIIGINTHDSEEQILQLLNNSPYDRLPLYEETFDQLIGIIHIRDTVKLLQNFNLSQLIEMVEPCHYVPENASLSSQLIQFQQRRHPMAFVIDEYGNIKGLITIEDILGEIVGDYTTDITDEVVEYEHLNDGSLNVNGEYSLRDLQTEHKIILESQMETTVNGFILEIYGEIPPAKISIKYRDYVLEVREVNDGFISLVNISKFSKNVFKEPTTKRINNDKS